MLSQSFRVAAVLCGLLLSTGVHADIVDVTVTGQIVQSYAYAGSGGDVDVSGAAIGDPFTWKGTYDTSIASSPYAGGYSDAHALLSTSVTIGSNTWNFASDSLHMAMYCCNSPVAGYPDIVAFYGYGTTSGPSLASSVGTLAPRDLNYEFVSYTNVLSSEATPTAAQLSLLPPGMLNFTFDQGAFLVDVVGGGTQQVTITFRPPTLSLTVTPSTVAVGDTAELDWSGTNLASCTASGVWTGPEPTSGQLAVTTTKIGSSTYTLTCTGLDGSTVTSSAVLKVIPRPTVSLTANGKAVAVVTGSGEVTLEWSSTYATACIASGAWSGAEPTSGSLSFAATAKSFQTYTLSCIGKDGKTARHSAYVWAH